MFFLIVNYNDAAAGGYILYQLIMTPPPAAIILYQLIMTPPPAAIILYVSSGVFKVTHIIYSKNCETLNTPLETIEDHVR